MINKPKDKEKTNLSEEEELERSVSKTLLHNIVHASNLFTKLNNNSFFAFQKAFMDKNKEAIKKYGMLREYHDSEEYLGKNPLLACEFTANYLVIWCIDLEVEEVPCFFGSCSLERDV